MKFGTRLIVYYLTAALLSMLLVGLAVINGIEYYGMQTVEQQLIKQSESATVYVTQTLLLEKSEAQGLKQNAGEITNNLSAGNRIVRIYDQNIKLISGSVDGIEQTKSQITGPKDALFEAIKGNYAYVVNSNNVYFAAPIELKEVNIGVLEFVYSLDFLSQIQQVTTRIITAGATAFGLLITLLSIYISRVMVKPIKKLVTATTRFARQDFTPIKINRSDELGQLSVGFNQMGAQLQDYIQRQRQFVSNVSHELRTPLTAIKGYSEYLIDEVENRPDLQKAVYHLNNESARLTKLVNELLLLSSLDAQREEFVFTKINLTELTAESIAKMQIQADKYEVVVNKDLQPNIHIQGDSEKLTQAFINLLGNAIKYSPAGGLVKVALTKHEQQALITITDQGPGIPAEDINKVFDRFYRAKNAKAVGGTGLGLAITKEIVTKHKGSIQLSPQNEVGTVVKVLLPLLE
ncbi:MAG: HAMP domain-containing histidine kinase [Firmicutes bacterium]|nr:HAMP domain-containing histidine kinase [Bacillota bacterium]